MAVAEVRTQIYLQRPEKGLDPVWSLLDQAAQIGGSGDAGGSHRVEEDLYVRPRRSDGGS